MNVYKLTASQLVNLLQVLGALVADYINNPKKPASKELVPLLKSSLQWTQLESLQEAVDTARTGGDKLSVLYNLGVELKTAMPEFNQQRDYTAPELKMLNALRSYLATDSESALRYIVKSASIFKSPALAQAFSPAVPEQVDHSRLKKVVKSLVGRDSVYLTPDEAKMLQETDPSGYAQYQQLRKQHGNDFKSLLMKYVRESGESKLPYQDVYNHFFQLGFTHSLIPGFTGLIDDQGRWFTQDEQLIDQVPNINTYSHVVMNKDKGHNVSYVCLKVKPDGTVGHVYTVAFAKQQSKQKYEHVADLMSEIKNIRAKWFAKIKNFNMQDKNCVAAVVLEILFGFAARIGSAPGRGAGTLLIGNVRVTTKGINLAYNGKDSIPTKHVLLNTDPEQRIVIAALEQLMADKDKRTMFLFTYKKPTGTHVRVTPADVNAAFHAFGAPSTVTVHKLRTCRGTTLFKQLMDADSKRRAPKDAKEALLRYKKMTETVGKLLNHKRGVGGSNEKVTGVTAANSYIDRTLQAELWRTWDIRPPANLEKLFSESDE